MDWKNILESYEEFTANYYMNIEEEYLVNKEIEKERGE